MSASTNKLKDPNSWNDTFFLFNIEIIDKQHKKLFQLFDLIIELNTTSGDFESISKIIDELDEYADYHFETEEDLMKKAGIIETDIHLQQHAFFKNQVEEFRKMYVYHNQSLADLMIVFLKKWFLVHIYDVDRQYVKPVKQYLDTCI